MPADRHPLPLQLRTITVTFASAARTLSLIGDETMLRLAHDRAQQLLSRLEPADDPNRQRLVLEARDTLLATYRHHLERCAAEPYEVRPGGERREG